MGEKHQLGRYVYCVGVMKNMINSGEDSIRAGDAVTVCGKH